MKTLVPDKRIQSLVALNIKDLIEKAMTKGSNKQPHNITILSGRTIKAKYFRTMPMNLICGRDNRNIFFKFRIDCITNIESSTKNQGALNGKKQS
jgi:hypothetical protein